MLGAPSPASLATGELWAQGKEQERKTWDVNTHELPHEHASTHNK